MKLPKFCKKFSHAGTGSVKARESMSSGQAGVRAGGSTLVLLEVKLHFIAAGSDGSVITLTAKLLSCPEGIANTSVECVGREGQPKTGGALRSSMPKPRKSVRPHAPTGRHEVLEQR